MQIDFSDAPRDPIERLMWLGGAKSRFESEVDAQWRRAYYEARLTGRLPMAIGLGLHSTKRVLAYTRAENESRGRLIRWGDGLSH